ncbi:MAG: class I SAM-dependent methyltransferase, partial [Bacteroidota bacterium]
MIAIIKSYLKFLLSSTNQHGIHSPFVYDLTTKCFYVSSKEVNDLTNKVNDYRKSLLKNTQTIIVTDFG